MVLSTVSTNQSQPKLNKFEDLVSFLTAGQAAITVQDTQVSGNRDALLAEIQSVWNQGNGAPEYFDSTEFIIKLSLGEVSVYKLFNPEAQKYTNPGGDICYLLLAENGTPEDFFLIVFGRFLEDASTVYYCTHKGEQSRSQYYATNPKAEQTHAIVVALDELVAGLL